MPYTKEMEGALLIFNYLYYSKIVNEKVIYISATTNEKVIWHVWFYISSC